MSAKYSDKDLQQHLAQEHKISPFSQYLREIVYGGNDGIVTTFAVVAGFTGAQNSIFLTSNAYLAVLLFGFANLLADGASMSLGNFLSIRSAQDVFTKERKKEKHEVENSPESEKAETLQIYKNKGFSPSQARDLTAIIATNKKYWVEFMMKDELEMADPTGDNPYLAALVTFLSFVCFGLIPLLPYVIMKNTQVFSLSAASTLFALMLLGLLRFRVTRENLIRSVGEIVAVGGLSAIIAYIVGTLFAG